MQNTQFARSVDGPMAIIPNEFEGESLVAVTSARWIYALGASKCSILSVMWTNSSRKVGKSNTECEQQARGVPVSVNFDEKNEPKKQLQNKQKPSLTFVNIIKKIIICCFCVSPLLFVVYYYFISTIFVEFSLLWFWRLPLLSEFMIPSCRKGHPWLFFCGESNGINHFSVGCRECCFYMELKNSVLDHVCGPRTWTIKRYMSRRICRASTAYLTLTRARRGASPRE